jgi:hypothetical protein
LNARTEPALYRHSSKFFVLFLVLMVVAFWPSYFARLFEQPSFWFHAHGIVLTLWGVLLVVQAQLIRTKRRPLHRALGLSAYVIGPAVVVITGMFVHYRLAEQLAGVPRLPAMALHFMALTLLALVVFAVFFGLAIYHRRDSQLHARWMICTVFPLFTPITDRLIGGHFRSLIAYVPRIEGNPILPAAGFALADLIVLGLALWDWRANKRAVAFPAALGVLLVYHVGAFTLHGSALWNSICVWFLSLPLS